MRAKSIFGALVFPFLATTAVASPITRLTLSRVQEIAERSSAEVLRAAADLEVARAESQRDRAGRMLAPTATAVVGPCFNGSPTVCFQTMLDVPLPRIGEGRAQDDVGQARLRAGELTAVVSRWRARWLATRAYIAVLAARARSRAAEDAAQLARQLREAVGARARLGDAARLDELQAGAREIARERELASARLEDRTARLDLQRLLLRADEAVEIVDDLSTATNRLLALAIVPGLETPRLKEARGLLALSEAETVLVETRRRVPFSLQASYQRDDASHQIYFGIAVPLTAVSSVPEAEARAARATSARRRAELVLLERELALAIQSARQKLAAARPVWEIAQRERTRAAEVAALLTAAYRRGQVDITRVIAAEQARLEAVRQEVRAATDVALAALLLAAGGAP